MDDEKRLTSMDVEDQLLNDIHTEKDPAKKKDLAEAYKTIKEANINEVIQSEKLRVEQETLDLNRTKANNEKKYQIASLILTLVVGGITAGCKIAEKTEEGKQKRLFQKEGFESEATGQAIYNPKKRWL